MKQNMSYRNYLPVTILAAIMVLCTLAVFPVLVTGPIGFVQNLSEEAVATVQESLTNPPRKESEDASNTATKPTASPKPVPDFISNPPQIQLYESPSSTYSLAIQWQRREQEFMKIDCRYQLMINNRSTSRPVSEILQQEPFACRGYAPYQVFTTVIGWTANDKLLFHDKILNETRTDPSAATVHILDFSENLRATTSATVYDATTYQAIEENSPADILALESKKNESTDTYTLAFQDIESGEIIWEKTFLEKFSVRYDSINGGYLVFERLERNFDDDEIDNDMVATRFSFLDAETLALRQLYTTDFFVTWNRGCARPYITSEPGKITFNNGTCFQLYETNSAEVQTIELGL